MAGFGGDLFSCFEETGSIIKDSVIDDSENNGQNDEDMPLSAKRLHAPSDDLNEIDAKKLKHEIEEEVNLAENMPRITVHRLETPETCTHELALPPGEEFVALKIPTSKPPKEYPFVLDPFQKESVLCIENNQSVLVSAHTSAGKTVVAEYAIAISLRDKQRVIYTTPIKALSNQKYREFYEEFSDVGLMTGDVTINPDASCLIMTTEILRSMLYRGSEIMRECAWVIFDEIHYMRDKERGVVWEETIILLPDNVHYVFLSATIPNARQFAEWICHVHKQPCHVVYTDYRPTPLQHYIFPAGGEGVHLVVDERSNFLEDNFHSAMSVLMNSGAGAADQRGRSGGFKGESDCFKVVKMIMERNLAPVIAFSFSKKDCEAYATLMAKLDFNTEAEKKLVEEVFNNAIDTLSDEDKKLPQIEAVLPLLMKGIGIHHGGLLPLLKETIEILFGEGLIKALFATETFAMGLNMPARTVLFTTPRKFDGKEFRWIASGEYIQMSGRAGRRGLDDKGIVMLMVDEKMSPGAAKNILKGQPDPLNSAFHLTYNMVLNLLRVEEINPEYMLERSFYQFQNYAVIPEIVNKLKVLQKQHAAFAIENEDQIASYYKIRQQLHHFGKELKNYIQKPQYILPFLYPGRMVKIVRNEYDFGWGVVVNFKKNVNQSKTLEFTEPTYTVYVMLYVLKTSGHHNKITDIIPCPPSEKEKGVMQVIPISLELLEKISAIRLYVPSDLKSNDNRLSVFKSLLEVQNRFPDGVPLLDPIQDMGIKDKELVEIVKKIEAFEKRLYSHSLRNELNLQEMYNTYDNKVKLMNDIKDAKAELKKKRSLLQMNDLKCMKRVLRRLGYANSSDVIEIKGRVACEISAADELVMTELLFNNVFNDLTPQQAAALISVFCFDENAKNSPKLCDELSGPLRILQETAKRVAKISIESKIEMNVDDYIDSFKPEIMDIVFEWCNGCPFGELCKMSDIFEGSIIRSMRLLEETLRQMLQAAKVIGNSELENKFSESIRMIKRDIVFAASLYL